MSSITYPSVTGRSLHTRLARGNVQVWGNDPSNGRATAGAASVARSDGIDRRRCASPLRDPDLSFYGNALPTQAGPNEPQQHLLQRVRSLKVPTAIHAVMVLAAALALPLRVSDWFGAPTGW